MSSRWACRCSWPAAQRSRLRRRRSCLRIELYKTGETELDNRRYDEARQNFRKIVERHPNSSYAPKARFYIGEAFYREAEFDKAVKEFEAFLAFFPGTRSRTWSSIGWP